MNSTVSLISVSIIKYLHFLRGFRANWGGGGGGGTWCQGWSFNVNSFTLNCQFYVPSRPIPGVFTFPVLVTCPRPNGFHLRLIIVPVCFFFCFFLVHVALPCLCQVVWYPSGAFWCPLLLFQVCWCQFFFVSFLFVCFLMSFGVFCVLLVSRVLCSGVPYLWWRCLLLCLIGSCCLWLFFVASQSLVSFQL